MKSFLPILIIVVVSVVSKVSANSSGTGSCAAGVASLGGPHAAGAIGTLPEGATVVQIGSTILTAGTPSTFPANTDLTWTVTAAQVPYKGIFVRVQADASIAFTNVGTQADLQNVALCDALTDNVVGVTHRTSALKSTNSGVLNFSAQGSAIMDIAVVFFSNATLSISAFSSFPITIGTGAPTPAAPTPVAAPVATPVAAPVVAGTPTAPAPVAAPTATAPVATPPTAEPPAPTDAECPDDGKGKGKGGKGGMMGMMSMKCKGGMMMGMETKSPKSPKTPKSGEGKGKGSNTTDTGKGKGDGRVRYLN
jgi:hypothetical protein